MLVAALAVTLVGFILLVVALVISSVAFAWGCIGVCILGLVLLIVDVVRGKGRSGEESAGGEQEDDRDDAADAAAYDDGGGVHAQGPGAEDSDRYGGPPDYAEGSGQ